MKIGFFIDSYLPVIHGVTVSIETFKKGLEDLGQEVFIFAPRHRGYSDKDSQVFRFPSLKVMRKPEMYLAFPFLPIKTFRKIINLKLDIVHSHSPFSVGFFGKGIAYYQKSPFIYTHHTQYPEYAKIYMKEKFLIPYLAKLLIKRHSNISNVVIAPSYKIKKVLKSYGVRKPIYILPTGIDLSVFKKTPKDAQFLRKNFGASPETKILLSVGRIGEEKNLGFIMEMFREVLRKRQDVLLVFVGDGPHLKKLHRMAKKLRLISNLRIMGFIPHEKIPAFYQNSDIFVFSSLIDTQAIVLLEAMSCGLPVVALKDGILQGVVEDNKNGFVIERPSKFTFAQKVLQILDNKIIYQKFSENSLEIANNFSNKNQAKKLIDIYEIALAFYKR